MEGGGISLHVSGITVVYYVSVIFLYIQPDDGRTLWRKHIVEFTFSKPIYHPVLSCV
jgi:hypothetical protein